MKASVCKRIAALEAKIKTERDISNLDAEIQEMTACERNILREFLMALKDGGQPVSERFDELKLAAENAVYAARLRLKIS